MKLIIKKLQGEELVLEVNEFSSILQIKKNIFLQLNIPIYKQKLVFQGKLLVDDKHVKDYTMIKDGSKINLMVKEPESMHNALKKLIGKYLSPEQAEKYAKEISLDLVKKMDNMSLDDIARVVKYYKEEDEKALMSI